MHLLGQLWLFLQLPYFRHQAKLESLVSWKVSGGQDERTVDSLEHGAFWAGFIRYVMFCDNDLAKKMMRGAFEIPKTL